jgi:hypothetical protein
MDTTNSYAVRLAINSSGNVEVKYDLDVDGHTNLDNVSIAGVTTISNKTQVNSLGIGIQPLDHHHIHIESANPRILIRSTGTNASKIFFGDNSSNDPGVIEYEHTNNRMRFGTNNTEDRLVINSTGQVLIGAGAVATTKVTQSGSLDLDSGGISLCIGGDENSSGRTNSTNKLNRVVTPHYANAEEPMAMISGYSSQNASELFYGGGSGLTNAATRHSFYTASNSTTTSGTERIRMVSNGQIIFGEANTSPVSDLEIRRANSGGDVSIRIGNNSGTNSGTTASLYFTTSPSQTFNTSYIQAKRDGGKLDFGYATNSPTVTMHVSQNRVGINETAPDSLLHLTTNNSGAYSTSTTNTVNSTNALLRLENTNGSDGSGVNNYVGMYFRVGSGANSDSQLQYVRTGDNQGAFQFKARNAGSTYPNLMTIKSDGNIGINQTTPTRARLHVVGPSSSGTEIVAKFKGASGADARTKIGLAAAYSDTANDTEGQAYVGALRNGSGNSSSLFFEVSNGSTLKELARVDTGGINVGGSYRFNNGARDGTTMPNSHNIGDVSSNTISYQHNAGFYYVYATIPTDGNWYDMFTSINDSACNFRGVCGDASSKNSFYWYFNPTSPSYGVNPYGEKWHHGSWNTGSVTFRLDGTHPNWNLQIKCTSYYGTNRTASLRAIMEVYY